MSALVQFATCKLCGEKLELPPMKTIVGESIDPKHVRKLEKLIAHHMQFHHADVLRMAVMWQGVIAGYFALSQFQSDDQVIRMIQDHQRISLLRVCGRRMTDEDLIAIARECLVEGGINSRDLAVKLRALYEEHEAVAALEASGLKVPRAFMEENKSLTEV